MNCHYPFELPPLPYAYTALEPHISAQTLMLHHDKHFKTYVDNLNQALEKCPAYHDWSLERLMTENRRLPYRIRTAVWNNAGGVYNHALYFSILGPGENQPSGKLEEAIRTCFGSVEQLLIQLKKCALAQFGSGYAWLACSGTGRLKILSSANQNTPLPCRLFPLMNLDVWEHAYYLQYQNRRADYIDQFLQVVDWEEIERNYAAHSRLA